MSQNFNILSNIKKVVKSKSIFISKPVDGSELPFSETLGIGENAIDNIDIVTFE